MICIAPYFPSTASHQHPATPRQVVFIDPAACVSNTITAFPAFSYLPVWPQAHRWQIQDHKPTGTEVRRHINQSDSLGLRLLPEHWLGSVVQLLSDSNRGIPVSPSGSGDREALSDCDFHIVQTQSTLSSSKRPSESGWDSGKHLSDSRHDSNWPVQLLPNSDKQSTASPPSGNSREAVLDYASYIAQMQSALDSGRRRSEAHHDSSHLDTLTPNSGDSLPESGYDSGKFPSELHPGSCRLNTLVPESGKRSSKSHPDSKHRQSDVHLNSGCRPARLSFDSDNFDAKSAPYSRNCRSELRLDSSHLNASPPESGDRLPASHLDSGSRPARLPNNLGNLGAKSAPDSNCRQSDLHLDFSSDSTPLPSASHNLDAQSAPDSNHRHSDVHLDSSSRQSDVHLNSHSPKTKSDADSGASPESHLDSRSPQPVLNNHQQGVLS